MTLRQLEIFSAIVETGRFTKAAEKLYVAQPSVSQQIQALEDELGELLFTRLKNRKVRLTEAGQILKGQADIILRQCQIARMEISSLSKEPSGRVRVGIGGHQLLNSMLPLVLSEFHARYPKICVDIVNGATPQLVEMLQTNRLDLAILNLPIVAKALRVETLFTEEMVLVVDDKHSLAGKKVVGPAEISQIDLILYDQTTNMRRRLDAFFREKNISPRVLFESSSVEIMKRMVEAGLCSAIIPSSNLLEGPEKNLRALRIRGKPLTREVGIAAPDVWRIPKVLDTLLALLRKQFDEVKPLIQDAFSQSRLNAGINVGEAGRRSKTPPVRP